MNNQDFIRNYPRESLHLFILIICCFWQIILAIAVILFYWVLVKLMKLKSWVIIGIGFLLLSLINIINYFYSPIVRLADFIQHGFILHIKFWKYYLLYGPAAGFKFFYQTEFNYIVSFGIIAAGILALIDLLFKHAHQDEIELLQNKKELNKEKIPAKTIDMSLNNINDHSFDGTVLGVSTESGHYVVIEDKVINQIVLVLGTTGGGKTITLRRFYQRAITKGYPLIIIDGKPTDENISWVKNLTVKHNRSFYGFNCGDYQHYDPLSDGGYTELKDKVISLKDQWDSDYYRSIAEDYLQTAFEVLIKSGKKFDLKTIASCLNYDELCILVRQINDAALLKVSAPSSPSFKPI